MTLSKSFTWILILALTGTLVLISLLAGSVSINLGDVFNSHSEMARLVFFESRIPRTCTAVLAGASLSLSGLFMQTLFRNPLAGPSVLGVSSGASLAVAIITMTAIFQSFHAVHLAVGGIIGSFAVLAILVWVARKFNDLSSVLIVGLMLSFFTSSIVSLLSSMASDSGLKSFVFWGFGSFADLGSSQLLIFSVPILMGLLISPVFMKPLNALLLGELHAKSLGVDPLKLRRSLILTTGVLTGVVTAFCGPIAFIGLTAPHIARFVFKTSDHRTLVPASIVLGSFIGLATDIIARLPGSDYALPLNTVCAFMGAPVIIYLIYKGRNRKVLI